MQIWKIFIQSIALMYSNYFLVKTTNVYYMSLFAVVESISLSVCNI